MSPAPTGEEDGPRRVLMIGHSHLAALERALKAGETLGQGGGGLRFRPLQLLNAPALTPPFTDAGLVPALQEVLAEPGLAAIVAVIGGNTHNTLALLNPLAPFDLIVPEAPGLPLDPAARLMPWGLACRTIAARNAENLRLFDLLAAAGLPLTLVESPPPIPSEAHIRAHPGVFAGAIDTRGVSPALRRWKFWRAQSAVWRAACARTGAHFLPVPPATMDDDGMLRPEYWNPDPTHGNAAYGAQVLASLRGHLHDRARAA